MTVAQRSMALNIAKWGLNQLTQYYPEQTISAQDKERVEKFAALCKRWMTREPETPQLVFLRACDVLGLEPTEVRKILRIL